MDDHIDFVTDISRGFLYVMELEHLTIVQSKGKCI